ncbi:MAG: dihydroorotate dehydrogenase [Tabrizicola sp.]|nr:dihydroorotate dehydrogenase [Tabrizicola sp.]
MQDDRIDDLLTLAARERPLPSEALIDRVLADALRQQQQQVAKAPVRRTRPGLLSRLAAGFGGGPALAGLCSALILGVTVGYLDPTSLDYLTGTTIDAVDLFPTVDAMLTEG